MNTSLFFAVFALVFVTLAVSASDDPFSGLEEDLVTEIKKWKKGSPPPKQLLCFPDGPPKVEFRCGMLYWGECSSHYISRIKNTDLLYAMLFDPQADSVCFHATSRQLLELVGVRELRATLATRRKNDSKGYFGKEATVLSQLLNFSYAKIKVACLQKKDVEKDLAVQVLRDLKSDLSDGRTWDTAYRRAADRLLDKKRSEKEGGSRTFLCYKYAGLISPSGFDILSYSISDELLPEHIQKVFAAKGAVRLLETNDAYWLYHCEGICE